MKLIGQFTFLFLSIAVSTAVTGFVLMKMWGWFIAPTFEAPALTFIQAAGLMTLRSFLRSKHDTKEKEKTFDENIKELMDAMLKVIILSGLTLFIGWVLIRL
jgi:hypothetical protein